MSNGLEPDQDRHKVGPDLGPNCLQRLSANDKSRCMLGNFNVFCCRLLTFFQIIFFFSKKSFRNTIGVSNGLDTDQDRRSDLGLNCLQRLSADETSR